ncbi:hypothetical protein D3C86_1785990 [compost metagenome]
MGVEDFDKQLQSVRIGAFRPNQQDPRILENFGVFLRTRRPRHPLQQRFEKGILTVFLLGKPSVEVAALATDGSQEGAMHHRREIAQLAQGVRLILIGNPNHIRRHRQPFDVDHIAGKGEELCTEFVLAKLYP